MEFEYTIGSKVYKVSIELKDGYYNINLVDQSFKVNCSSISPHCFSMLIGDKSHTVYIADDAEGKYISLKGAHYLVRETAQKEAAQHGSPADLPVSDGLISAPMPGKIVKILVKEGEEVEQGQSLLILESMKMENSIASPFKGKVIKVNVDIGELAQPGESLIELEKL
jgi:biotin carboxyl carrier protein